MVAVDQNGGTRTFNSCSAKYARFLKLPSAEAGRQRKRVSSSLEGVPAVAVEKVYDGDPSNMHGITFEVVRPFQQARIRVKKLQFHKLSCIFLTHP